MTIIDKLKMCLRILKAKEEEDRCPYCERRGACIAYNTGVCKPCPDYQPERRPTNDRH